MFDGKAFGAQVVAAVKDHVGGLVAPLRERLAAVEATAKNLDQSELRETLSAVRERVAALEAREPAKGDKGADGLGFDDLDVLHDGERGFTFRFSREDQVKEFPFTLPVVIDRGVWKEGPYSKGDGVSWAGSFWIAQKDTDTKPDSGDGWRLSVKRGKDGKDKA